jgi:UDP-N-acetylmuramate--alanine ligase
MDFNISQNVQKFTYSSITDADFFASNIFVNDGKMKFDLVIKANKLSNIFQKRKEISFVLPGLHNISNAIAAAAVSFYIGVELDDIVAGIETFKGVCRRFDILINNKNLIFIDDYAHHPEEIKATIKATRHLFPNRDLTVVFQPHLYSRTQNQANDFASALSLANKLILMDIYPARENPIPGVNSEMLLSLCNNVNKETCSSVNLLNLLMKKDIDILLTIGAGDISDLVKPIKHMLN